jgi:hypothetical protein
VAVDVTADLEVALVTVGAPPGVSEGETGCGVVAVDELDVARFLADLAHLDAQLVVDRERTTTDRYFNRH